MARTVRTRVGNQLRPQHCGRSTDLVPDPRSLKPFSAKPTLIRPGDTGAHHRKASDDGRGSHDWPVPDIGISMSFRYCGMLL